MNSPDRAVRLMQRFGVYDALIGDLAEQRRAGRSSVWLWRQTVVAIAARLTAVVRDDPAVVGVAALTVAIDVALPVVWMHFLAHYAILLHVAWYQPTIGWLARSSPHPLWRMIVFLHPWEWTFIVEWCALLGVMAWCLVGIWPNRATLIIAMFVLANVCQTLPYLTGSFVDWAHDPLNSVWASKFLWYGFSTLVIMPASIFAGGRATARHQPAADCSAFR